jgi:septal ring factor EnvC (AmiA/AmiB activator)
VNIFDFTHRKRPISGSVFETIFGTASSSGKIYPRLSPQYAYFSCWLLVATFSLFVLSGCGTYKDELDSAKQQIEKLNLEIKKLTEEGTRLNQEKNRLSDDSKTLSDKNTQIQRDLDDLNKAKAACLSENKEIKNKYAVVVEEIAALKREKAKLNQEIEELKKRVAETAPLSTSPTTMQTEVLAPKRLEELGPCEVVFAFMNASEGIIRQLKG